MLWRAGTFKFEFPRPTLVMGILNITPDSFSDGGRFLSTDAAVVRGLELIEQGADILDVGGESTRPGATPVSQTEELGRVLPVIGGLARAVDVPISIDTYKSGVAAAALAAGASIVNDIGASRHDSTMAEVVARTGAGYVAVHMEGTPQTMQLNPEYQDVTATVKAFFGDVLTRLESAGVERERIALDVGIGFGKTLQHNLELLANMNQFAGLGRPLVLGVSRKSFIGSLVGSPVNARLAGSLAAACLGAQTGVTVVRTHDVAETVQALRVTEAIVARRSS